MTEALVHGAAARESVLLALADKIPELIAYYEARELRCVFANKGYAQANGCSAESIVGKTVREIVGEDAWRVIEPHAAQALRGEKAEYLRDLRLPGGEGRVIEVHLDPHLGGRGEVLGIFVLVTDVTRHQLAEARIQYLAHHDMLTGLPNRAYVTERLSAILALARRHRSMAAVMSIDLDDFKAVNDTLGHHSGDTLLKLTASRIRQVLREADMVSRLGSDEFLVILADFSASDDAALVAEKMLQTISAPVVIEGRELRAQASIGVSVFPRDGDSAEELIARADIALHAAKAEGRGRSRFYAPGAIDATADALARESRLREALQRAEFVLYYQPQLCVADQRLVGVEALLRWRHPQRGLADPSEFIEFAETHGLIGEIGQYVLREACRQSKAWQDAGLAPLPIAVNVSAAQFQRRDLVAEVARVLEDTGLEGRWLELELTESMLLDKDVVGEALAGLRALGVRIAIDDFGTGYSSLSYLNQLPVDKLKIDRSFIDDLGVDADERAIAIAIINLAKTLKLTVLAEGVERQEQLEFLRAHGCDEYQGYLAGAPLAAEEFGAFVRG